MCDPCIAPIHPLKDASGGVWVIDMMENHDLSTIDEAPDLQTSPNLLASHKQPTPWVLLRKSAR